MNTRAKYLLVPLPNHNTEHAVNVIRQAIAQTRLADGPVLPVETDETGRLVLSPNPPKFTESEISVGDCVCGHDCASHTRRAALTRAHGCTACACIEFRPVRP